MSVLVSKRRVLGPVLIIMLGLLGLWLGSHSQFWLGLTVFLAAFAGLVVMSHLDLRPTEQERRSRWRRIREKGKLRYVGLQVLRGAPIMLFQLVIELGGSYQSGTPWNPLGFATFCALLIGGLVLISLGWWTWQERKFGSAS